MQLTTLIAAALCAAGAASAAPADNDAPPKTEDFFIMNLQYKKAPNGKISDLSFTGDGKADFEMLTCTDDHPRYPEPKKATVCLGQNGRSPYSFAVHFESADSVRVRVYNVWSGNKELWGEVIIPIECHEDSHTCFGIGPSGPQAPFQSNHVVLNLGTPPNFP